MDDLTEWTRDWPVNWASIGVTNAEATLGAGPDPTEPIRIASISKMLAAYAGLVAIEEESLTLDEPVGPEGSTVRHLLAHASGLGFNSTTPAAEVGRRRLYSNAGIDLFASHLAEATGFSFEEYLTQAVFDPLEMTSTYLRGTPAHGVNSTISDLLRFARELIRPMLISESTLLEARSVQFPGLAGKLPGIVSFDPNPFGLGFEIRGHKEPHWTAPTNSPDTFGHFGGSGSFLWVDPGVGLGAVSLADQDFGPWSMEAWPKVGARILSTYAGVQ